LRFEVLNRDDMNALSRKLSREGIMNRTKEEVAPDISHYLVVTGKYSELAENAEGIKPMEEYLDELDKAFQDVVGGWGTGEARDINDLFDESDISRLLLMTALLENGVAEESGGKVTLLTVPKLDELEVELRFPIEEVEEYLEEMERRFETSMITEFALGKHYYVEVMEVERDLVEAAIDLAEEYATDESIVSAMFEGIARAVLADVVLDLAQKYRKKNELIEAVLEREPITVEGAGERVNVYFDEDSLEDFLKELQSLGYLKVKGNRIWA